MHHYSWINLSIRTSLREFLYPFRSVSISNLPEFVLGQIWIDCESFLVYTFSFLRWFPWSLTALDWLYAWLGSRTNLRHFQGFPSCNLYYHWLLLFIRRKQSKLWLFGFVLQSVFSIRQLGIFRQRLADHCKVILFNFRIFTQPSAKLGALLYHCLHSLDHIYLV